MNPVFFDMTAAVFGWMLCVYVIALIKRNNALADPAWALGFVVAAITAESSAAVTTPRQSLMTILTALWGIRLAAHLIVRIQGKPEDFRYAAMRERWGKAAPLKSLTHVFLSQAALLCVIALPIGLVNAFPKSGLTPLDVIGMLSWLFGFCFETIADAQLKRFIRREKTPGNPIMTQGLWRYSRHPNYFGEAAMWWGIGLIALNVRHGWIGLFGPGLLTFLLLKVSGVPLLEKKYSEIPQFREYARRTSTFVPWKPRSV